jgi:hypothetical protein
VRDLALSGMSSTRLTQFSQFEELPLSADLSLRGPSTLHRLLFSNSFPMGRLGIFRFSENHQLMYMDGVM